MIKKYIAFVVRINYKKFEYDYVFKNNYNKESLQRTYQIYLNKSINKNRMVKLYFSIKQKKHQYFT